MSSSMHVYGGMAQPAMLDRWPAPNASVGRVTFPRRPAWAAPNVATRVEMAPPTIWGAPDPELLRSITIAPLRFSPVSWGPPQVVQSPWGPPVIVTAADPVDTRSGDTRTVRAHRRRRPRAMAFGCATAAVAVASTVAFIVAR